MRVLHRSKNDKLMKTGLRTSEKFPLSRVTLASMESLTVPLVQEVVLLADFRCKGCQERVADIMLKMNGVAESVVVSVMDKRVTLTCTYPRFVKLHRPQVAGICENSIKKITFFTQLFRASCS